MHFSEWNKFVVYTVGSLNQVWETEVARVLKNRRNIGAKN